MAKRSRAPKVPVLAQHHVPRAKPPMVEATRANVRATLNAAKQAAARAWGPNVIEVVRQQVRDRLSKSGLPTDAKTLWVIQRDRTIVWRGDDVAPYQTGARDVAGNSFRSGLADLAAALGHPVGGDVWYAARILDQLGAYDSAKERDARPALVDATFHLGLLLHEAHVVISYGTAIDVALKSYPKVAEGLARANAERTRDADQKWRQGADQHAKEIWRKHPSLSALECARRVLKRMGIVKNVHTVRKQISIHRPKIRVGRL